MKWLFFLGKGLMALSIAYAMEHPGYSYSMASIDVHANLPFFNYSN